MYMHSSSTTCSLLSLTCLLISVVHFLLTLQLMWAVQQSMQPKALLAMVYMTRSGPTYGIEGPGMGLNEWNLALPLLQDIINSGLFVFNTAPYAFPVPATGIFSYSNQSPVVNKEAIFDVMYLTGLVPGLGATHFHGIGSQRIF
jgi:hypothetical protein